MTIIPFFVLVSAAVGVVVGVANHREARDAKLPGIERHLWLWHSIFSFGAGILALLYAGALHLFVSVNPTVLPLATPLLVWFLACVSGLGCHRAVALHLQRVTRERILTRWAGRAKLGSVNLLVMLALLLVGGCASTTASDPPYRAANAARLLAVRPWLIVFQGEHPDMAPQVSPLIRSWEIEVDAQRRSAVLDGQ